MLTNRTKINHNEDIEKCLKVNRKIYYFIKTNE